MDASQYKDYVLVLLFMKYVTDRFRGDPDAPIAVPVGGSFDDMLAVRGDPEIGDKINQIVATLAESNVALSGVITAADFADPQKLGDGKEMVERLSNLVSIFARPELNFAGNDADGDDLLGDAYEYLMRHFAVQGGKSKGQFYNYAIATGRRTDANPAPALHRALSAPRVRNHPAIVDRRELGALLKAIDRYRGFASTAAALRISAHLFQRPGEIRTMRWADLDLDGARWIIPASNTKMRREHIVPLSRQAIEIICSMADIAGASEFVFPSHNPKKPLSENAVNGALRRLGYGGVMTAHGFRSTASSLLNESGRWNPDAIERALAHQDGNAVRAVYNRTAYWPERVEMMQWWSDELAALKTAAD